MSNIDTRSPFFPRSGNAQTDISKARRSGALQRNSYERVKEIESKTGRDAKVTIPEAIKDFSRIKKEVDAAPAIDNSEKIARLKAQIQDGTYKTDFDAIADKILSSEY